MCRRGALKHIAVLGATGSIGRSTLDVIRANRETLKPVLFTANSNEKALSALGAEFPSAKTVLCGSKKGILEKAIAECGADIAVNGIAGSDGLLPSLAVLENGIDLALANKETIVMASALVFAASAKSGSALIPVDSEHSAIFNLINAHGRENVKEIIITASGGPFRKFSAEQLKSVRPQDALSHPTWNMGAKITIDSASLANKGLEVIEAAKLFGFNDSSKIKVVVHPQSIIHSMVRLKNGAVFAEASQPDMRVPIHDAIFFPDVVDSPFGLLDFDDLNLSFEKPDLKRFPMLKLAYDALNAGGSYTIAYNAANEIAVKQFMEGRIGFMDIPEVCEKVLQMDFSLEPDSIQSILASDENARNLCRHHLGACTSAA
ncbi:MAG: 1-deoxy-D-xylulose-5-phosphate reductoisomerase [Termitinemataceae bacterium]|nr:MAG: 1-deoxy-D-xylulose-5-phosphate reductoisomerase [Termitinemataceae bacterium]